MQRSDDLTAACEALVWTGLARNNPEIVLTEDLLAAIVTKMIDAGVFLKDGTLRMPVE